MYPNAPDFRSGMRGAGWYKYQNGAGVLQACQSQGLTIVKAAQRTLRASGPIATNVFGPHLARRVDVTPDGIPGPATIKVLTAWLIGLGGAPEAVLADLEADFNRNNQTNTIGADVSRPGGPLSRGTMQALVFAAFHATGDIIRVEIQSNSTPVNWGVAPANDGDWANLHDCWDPMTAPPPGAPAGSAVPAPPAPSGGIVPSGSTGTTSAGLSTGARWWIGLGLGIAGVGVGAAIVVGSKKSKRRRRR